VNSRVFHLTTPLSEQDVAQLRAGDRVFLSGAIYTARDTAHKRLIEAMLSGEDLPFNPLGQAIYYAGPSPARPGAVIGACGPTTSGRMDAYTPALLKAGIRATIGKGKRSKEVVEAMKAHKAVYLGVVGGVAAVLAKCIKQADVVAYPDLGPEAVRHLVVEDFPTFVVNDVAGRDLYEEGAAQYAQR
jgi:fumarate hydratase subunit beta